MVEQYNLAVIGNGTSAVNAVDTFLNDVERTPSGVLPKISITIYGDSPEADCGRGYAHGKGSRVGLLTEMPEAADYSTSKGAFRAYAGQRLNRDPDEITAVNRSLVGDFHADRHQVNKLRASKLGVDLNYIEAHVDDAVKRGNYSIISKDRTIGHADRIIMALGDVLSPDLDSAAERFPGRVFRTPYEAVDSILANHSPDTIVLARGSRSSFVDLGNGLIEEGFQGTIEGTSANKITSWQGNGFIAYPLQHLDGHHEFSGVKGLLIAVQKELLNAQKHHVYIPSNLISQLGVFAKNMGDFDPNTKQLNARRIHWNFDINEEAKHADGVTYHDVLQAVPWDRVFAGVRNPAERRASITVLGDLALYNRVNRIIPEAYQTFVSNVQSGRIGFREAHFSDDHIQLCPDGRLMVSTPAGNITADYIVNCAIGPAAAATQVDKISLLSSLAQKGWISPAAGTGFTVNDRHAIDFIGVQGRRSSYDGIGIETNGRQIAKVVPKIVQGLISHATNNQVVLFRPAQPKSTVQTWSPANV